MPSVSILTNRVKINNSSGEVLEDVTFREDIDVSIIPFKVRSPFSKVFIGAMPNYSVNSYFGYFYILCLVLSRYSNIILSDIASFTIANRLDMCKMIGISMPSLKRFLRDSYDLGVIAFVHNRYIINPVYAMNGKGIDSSLFNIFRNDRYFVDSLTSLQIIKYNELTGENYFEHIRVNFFDIYKSKFKEQV